MPEHIHTGLRRIWNAAIFSIRGLRAAWVHEAAFRQELVLAALLAPAAFWLGATVAQRMLLIFSLFLILIIELLNSAIEAVVDRIGPEHHRLSGRAKDMGSAAVMISLITCAAVWAMAIWQRWHP